MTPSPDSPDLRYFLRAQRVDELQRLPGGLEMRLDGVERLRVDVLRANVLRIKISRGGKFDEQPTCAVLADGPAALGGEAAFSIEETADAVRLATAAAALTITKAPFAMSARRADGSLLFESARDKQGQPWAYATLNDEWLVSRRSDPQDAFYGLGEKTGPFDRQGRDFTLWNTDVLSPAVAREARAKYPGGPASGFGQKDMLELPPTERPIPPGQDPRADPTSTVFDPYYVSIPFFYHHPHGGSAMAGFFFDNSRRARVEFSAPGQYQLHFQGGQYTEYVFAGPRMPDILTAYTALTGRMQPPPVWALGHHQCRWHPYTQETFEELAAKYRDRKLPCDVLWLDIDYMRGYRVFTWNGETFPDPQAMLARLRAEGFRVITIIDPGVKYDPGYPVFDEAMRKNLLCRTPEGATYVGEVWPGRTAFPDFTLEETRQWWGRLNAEHVQSGLAGIWNDMNEPATGDVPNAAMCFAHGTQPHARGHNEYATLMAMGTVEGLLAAMPDRRTFVLSRAGSAGIQRYAANWMGDNCSRWEHLALSVPMAMGFGVSGQPFVGADVGGFIENTNLELLTRWYQYGALTPFFRNHSCKGKRDQYPWSFGAAAENVIRAAIELRYRLMPYIYTQFMLASETGAPVQRPLVFDHQDDDTARHVDDQYLFGRDLLVAPICQAGQGRRRMYLPPGLWYEWSQAGAPRGLFSGPSWMTMDDPAEGIPLFARGGSIIPMWPQAPVSTMDYQPEAIELHIFLPTEDGETHSTLHEDDGTTFANLKGAFCRTNFTLRREGREFTLQATVSGQGYPEFARGEFRLNFHGDLIPGSVEVDGAEHRLTLSGGKAGVTLANKGGGFVLRARL